MPEVGVEGQRKLKAATRAVRRRRRTGLASRAVPRGGRRRHARHRRLRHRGRRATSSARSSTARQDVGRSKLQSARGPPAAHEPRRRRSRRYETALTSTNALEIFRDYDVILDGTDNFPTRYLVNDACVLLGKPNAYGSIFRFEGQASVFATKGGPCYRCLYPGAAAARAGAELRRGRRARRAARRDRHDPGDRGDQADSRRRLDARRPAAALRRLDDAVPRAEAAARSGVPGVRRPSDHQGRSSTTSSSAASRRRSTTAAAGAAVPEIDRRRS